MSDLLLPTFRAKNYKCFAELSLQGLGRVNLIVGQNGVGKTSLLEAIWIWAAGDTWPLRIGALLQDRQEFATTLRGSVSNRLQATRLFNSPVYYAELGYDGNPDVYDCALSLQGGSALTPAHEQLGLQNWILSYSRDNQVIPHEMPKVTRWDLNSEPPDPLLFDFDPFVPSQYRSSHGASPGEMADLWDNLALSERGQSSVLDAVRLVDPRVQRLSYVGKGETRVPLVVLKDQDSPVPLRSLGDGAGHVVELAIRLHSAAGGIFLIDEFENGLHWSIQEVLWRVVFETAEVANVQVFATTHSFDCVRAFKDAAVDHSAEGRLIRLERVNGVIKQVAFDEALMSSAVDQGIEVR